MLRFLVTIADPSSLWARTKLFLFRSLGSLPVTGRGCATQGTDPLPPSSPVAKEHLLCGRKRVFTRKGFPSLPPRRCVSRHAAGDRHWPCSTGGCAVVSRKAENSTPSAREGEARLSSGNLARLERLSHRPSASKGSCTAAGTPSQRAFVQRAVRDLESLQPRLN